MLCPYLLPRPGIFIHHPRVLPRLAANPALTFVACPPLDSGIAATHLVRASNTAALLVVRRSITSGGAAPLVEAKMGRKCALPLLKRDVRMRLMTWAHADPELCCAD